MDSKKIDSISKKMDKNDKKENQIKNFADILDTIDSLEDKKKDVVERNI